MTKANDQGGRAGTAARRVVPATKWRDILLAVTVGAAVLGFVWCAVLTFSKQAASPGMVEGVILSKTFVPQAEEQISLGKGGLSARQVAGEYRFQVRVLSEGDKEYTVTADARTFAARGVGERLYFKK